jgi:hypothetical protein
MNEFLSLCALKVIVHNNIYCGAKRARENIEEIKANLMLTLNIFMKIV